MSSSNVRVDEQTADDYWSATTWTLFRFIKLNWSKKSPPHYVVDVQEMHHDVKRRWHNEASCPNAAMSIYLALVRQRIYTAGMGALVTDDGDLRWPLYSREHTDDVSFWLTAP
jgi:hypothetical protein